MRGTTRREERRHDAQVTHPTPVVLTVVAVARLFSAGDGGAREAGPQRLAEQRAPRGARSFSYDCSLVFLRAHSPRTARTSRNTPIAATRLSLPHPPLPSRLLIISIHRTMYHVPSAVYHIVLELTTKPQQRNLRPSQWATESLFKPQRKRARPPKRLAPHRVRARPPPGPSPTFLERLGLPTYARRTPSRADEA